MFLIFFFILKFKMNKSNIFQDYLTKLKKAFTELEKKDFTLSFTNKEDKNLQDLSDNLENVEFNTDGDNAIIVIYKDSNTILKIYNFSDEYKKYSYSEIKSFIDNAVLSQDIKIGPKVYYYYNDETKNIHFIVFQKLKFTYDYILRCISLDEFQSIEILRNNLKFIERCISQKIKMLLDKGYVHNDLHPKNIMFEINSQFTKYENKRYRILKKQLSNEDIDVFFIDADYLRSFEENKNNSYEIKNGLLHIHYNIGKYDENEIRIQLYLTSFLNIIEFLNIDYYTKSYFCKKILQLRQNKLKEVEDELDKKNDKNISTSSRIAIILDKKSSEIEDGVHLAQPIAKKSEEVGEDD